MDALEAIWERCSYRGTYLNTPVPRADLEAIMRAGLAAPSGCNKQTTSLIAVDDPVLVQRLFAAIAPGEGEPHPLVGGTAPAMVCVLARRIIAYGQRSYFVHDYSAAIENMLLAITALGYASCWVEGYVTDEDRLGRKMADILGVPEAYELVCYLPVGVAGEPLRRARKQPVEQRAWFNGFGG